MCAARRRRDDDDDDDFDISHKRRPKPQGFFAGFFDELMHRFIGRLIGVVVLFVVLGGLCCVGGIASYIAGPQAPFLGEWDSTNTKLVQRGEFQDNVPEATIIFEKDNMGGFGTFINENDQELHFTWAGHDKERKTVVCTMDIAGDKFWRGINSPATFTYDVNRNQMTLTHGKESITFTKIR